MSIILNIVPLFQSLSLVESLQKFDSGGTMKHLIITLIVLLSALTLQAKDPARILCYDRFDNEIWEMTGEHFDDKTCKAMMIAGTVGMCFEGSAAEIVKQMNDGLYEYSQWQKINSGTASELTKDIVKYGSYEGDFVPWTRTDNELFRCPEFSKIKEFTTQLADELESSTEYAVSRRYREEFGTPFWLE